jgi:hypothetical protein
MSEFIPSTVSPQIEDNPLATLKRIAAAGIPAAVATALASAARTSQTDSVVIDARHYSGIMVWLYCSASSGTGGISVQVIASDPTTAQGRNIQAFTTSSTSTGSHALLLRNGSMATNNSAFVGGVSTHPGLPPKFFLRVPHADASSYTYSVQYQLLP